MRRAVLSVLEELNHGIQMFPSSWTYDTRRRSKTSTCYFSPAFCTSTTSTAHLKKQILQKARKSNDLDVWSPYDSSAFSSSLDGVYIHISSLRLPSRKWTVTLGAITRSSCFRLLFSPIILSHIKVSCSISVHMVCIAGVHFGWIGFYLGGLLRFRLLPAVQWRGDDMKWDMVGQDGKG